MDSRGRIIDPLVTSLRHRYTKWPVASPTLTEQLREDVQKVDDPGFKVLFETVAEVLTGLEKAVGSFEEWIDKA